MWDKAIKYAVVGIIAVLAGTYVGGLFSILGQFALVGTVVVAGLVADMVMKK
jgi:hypothetical protein